MDGSQRTARPKGKDDLAEQIEAASSARRAAGSATCTWSAPRASSSSRVRSRTYHAKQLAQEAVLDMTDGLPALANQIEVC